MADPQYQYISKSMQSGVPVIGINETQMREANKCYQIRDEMLSALESIDSDHVLIDLSSLEFVGSIAFLAFLGVRRARSEGRIILCGLSPSIHDSFRLCNLVSDDPNSPGTFDVAATLETGAASVAH